MDTSETTFQNCRREIQNRRGDIMNFQGDLTIPLKGRAVDTSSAVCLGFGQVVNAESHQHLAQKHVLYHPA